MLTLTLSIALAGAAPSVRIEATVDPDAGTISGTLWADDLDGARWIDPLASLPVPTHELDSWRTFPGLPNTGHITTTTGDDGARHFVAHLPRRLGDTGVSAHGLFANGGWHPLPRVDGALPTIAWDVTVHLPDGVAGAVGNIAGTGTLRWTGTAERVSVAAIPGGRVTTWTGPSWTATALTRRRPRAQLRNAVVQLLDLARLPGVHDRGVLVEAPLSRRLFRPGAGLTYVSDRAWRVTPVFRWLHHRAGVGALLTAWHADPDPLVRGLAGHLRADRAAHRGAQQTARRTPGLIRNWRPVVDTLLFSREMPFQSEVFNAVVPFDPVRDDLVERFERTAPPTLLAAQARDVWGNETADALAAALAAGQPAPTALARSGVDPAWLDAWRTPYRPQDYQLTLDGDRAVVTRVTATDQPPEHVVLTVDDDGRRRTDPVRHVLAFGTGPGTKTLDLPPDAGRVRLDPARHAGQVSRLGDLRPAPMRFVVAGAISGINFSELFLNAYGAVAMRRADDTHNLGFVRLATNQREWIAAAVAYTRFVGPLTRLARRAHGFTFGIDGAWLSDRFADNNGADYAIGGRISYTYDDRTSALFPRRGTVFTATLDAGVLPQQPDRTYVRTTSTLVGIAPLHPRVVLAGRLSGGWARTDIPQERLFFGGFDGVRAIADRAVQTTAQGVSSVELRAVPLSRLGLPLGALTWIEDITVSIGMDAGVGRSDDGLVAAVAPTAGIGAVVQNFGVGPAAVNLTFGFPGWTLNIDAPADRGIPIELYLTWGVSF